MKKAYLNPAIEFDSMDTTDLMALSFDEETKQVKENLENAPTTDATSGNLSRRSIWDDEE